MYTLGFGIAWTVLAVVFVVAFSRQTDFQEQTAVFQVVMILMPLAGLLIVRNGWHRLRRLRSLREEDGFFVWTDLDGAEKRSTINPRSAWDAEDRDFSG